MSRTPVIVGLGLQSPVGVNLAANVAAVRAGLSAFRLSNYLRGYRSGEPLKVSQLAALPKGTTSYQRMLAMSVAAASEALEPLTALLPQGTMPQVAVSLSVPMERPGFTAAEGKDLFRELIKTLPIEAIQSASLLGATGHEGGLAALDYAAQMIRAGRLELCLVGGVESYQQIETLHWLEVQQRIKLDDEPNGLIPGEAAGFVLLCSEEFAARVGLLAVVEVLGGGRGKEPRHWSTGQPILGEGLTQAFRAAFSSPFYPLQQVRASFCDMNGESWRADEWSYAYVRTGEYHGSPMTLRHPASSWGDIGAASGPALVAMASADLNHIFQPQEIVLVWTASDMSPYRSAVLLRRVERQSL